MLKIGEFSKLSHLTIKALRFYEKRGLLIPQKVDEQTGYRFYETSQLKEAARIKSYRQLGLTIEEIQAINKGTNLKEVLISKAKVLESQKEEIESRGGKVAGSISSKTTYLINNDISSTSGKNKKAKELSIPIISEETFKTL